MEKKQNISEAIRIAIVGALLTIQFGVLQLYPEGTKFEKLGLQVISKLFAEVALDVAVILTLIFLCVIALKNKVKLFSDLSNFIFNLLVSLNLAIMLQVIMIVLALKISMFFNAVWIFIVLFCLAILLSTNVIILSLDRDVSAFTNWILGLKPLVWVKTKLAVFSPESLESERMTKRLKQYFVFFLPIFLSLAIAQFYFVAGVQNDVQSARQELNSTFWLTAPVVLSINQTYDEGTNILNITYENTHPLKDTGEIQFYRLNIDPFKPLEVEPSLGPGETSSIALPVHSACIDTAKSLGLYNSVTVNSDAYAKSYYATNAETTTYKITCDNCASQGFVRRYPKYREVKYATTVRNINGSLDMSICTLLFYWEDYSKEDLLALSNKLNKTAGAVSLTGTPELE